MSDSHQHTPGTPSDDVVENVAHVMPVVLPIVGGVMMLLLAFIAVKMA